MNNYQDILEDIQQVIPDESLTLPPYSSEMTFEEKFQMTFRTLGQAKSTGNRRMQLYNAYYLGVLLEEEAESLSQRSYYAQRLTKHYRTAAVRLYHIFKPVGVSHILKTSRITLTMVVQLKMLEFQSLLVQIHNIFNGS